jgi:phosphoribosylanthranilate isomerase
VKPSVHIKICGITSERDADLCLEHEVSAIGINLVPSSPRAADIETARRLVAHIDGRALTVLVVANLPLEKMQELYTSTGARCLQLHGDESAGALEALLPHAYKAVRIGDADDVAHALGYPGQYLLADAKVKGQLGGTGKVVDWELVRPLARTRKLTLAGGLTPLNVAEAIRAVEPFCVDVASGVERPGEPRRKDPELVASFVRAVREAARPAPC